MQQPFLYKRLALVAAVGGVLMAFCQYLIFIYAQASLGLSQKIFYTHLPMAWWSFVSFFVVLVAGIAYLKTRAPRWNTLAHAATEFGLVLNTLAIVTGSIWARHAWGVWWTWDPKLTTALVLWFLYAACLIVRHLDMPVARRNVLANVLGIVAFLDVPLVFIAARIWRAVHPFGAFERESWLTSEMQITAMAAVLFFGCIWLALLAIRVRQLDQLEKIDSLSFSLNHTISRL